MSFSLPDLPYKMHELAPHISQETLEYHYGKHHQSYVNNLNKLVEGGEFAELNLEDIIKRAQGGIFNNAAQIWNHTFYWHSLSPKGGGEPKSQLAERIAKDFGSFGEFKDAFSGAGATLFGSGWVFLVEDKTGKLAIKQEPNAGCPLVREEKPLITCDVWEHAYYIDYRNARPKYIESFWNLVNWDFAENNLLS